MFDLAGSFFHLRTSQFTLVPTKTEENEEEANANIKHCTDPSRDATILPVNGCAHESDWSELGVKDSQRNTKNSPDHVEDAPSAHGRLILRDATVVPQHGVAGLPHSG